MSFQKQDIDFYLKEQQKLLRYTIANKVYFGKVKWETSFSKARKLEVGNNRTASQLSSKLQCFQWIEILNTLQKKGVLNDFLNVAYYGAKKILPKIFLRNILKKCSIFLVNDIIRINRSMIC